MGRLYLVRLWFTKLSPARIFGCIPKIGEETLRERLRRYSIDDLEKYRVREGVYSIPIGDGLVLEIEERRDAQLYGEEGYRDERPDVYA